MDCLLAERRFAMADADKIARIFKMLSVEARILILQSLKKRAMCVYELTSQLGISQSATSQHLSVLKNVGIVKSQKRGVQVYYYLDKQNIAKLEKITSMLFKLDD
jgi:DNA-binding transcriptional ArsR family regulator